MHFSITSLTLIRRSTITVVTLAYVLIVLYLHSYIGYVQTVICIYLTLILLMVVIWPYHGLDIRSKISYMLIACQRGR
jgi:hypothetical protein